MQEHCRKSQLRAAIFLASARVKLSSFARESTWFPEREPDSARGEIYHDIDRERIRKTEAARP